MAQPFPFSSRPSGLHLAHCHWLSRLPRGLLELRGRWAQHLQVKRLPQPSDSPARVTSCPLPAHGGSQRMMMLCPCLQLSEWTMSDLGTTRLALQVTGGEKGAARRPLKSVWEVTPAWWLQLAPWFRAVIMCPQKWERALVLRFNAVVECPDAILANPATDLWGWCTAWRGNLTAWQMAH